MDRTHQRLTALAVSRAAKPGYLADGGGLYLQTTAAGARSWIYRYSLDKKRREMGLGPFPAITLAAARASASEARTLLKAGQDPIAARDAQRAAQQLQAAHVVTFDEASRQFIKANKAAWKNAKHQDQWTNTLATHASPTIGTLAVGAVGVSEVITILEPLWTTKPETASRVRGRIERVLDWAKVRGYRSGENPARWRGHLDKILPARNKVRSVKHHAAVAIDDTASVYARLRASSGMAALAVRFVILTAARAGEVTGARWSEVDTQAGVWTVPADRIKAAREHRVPLSGEALEIVKALRETASGEFVFPGWVTGKPLSLTSLSKALDTAGGEGKTVHGFRSTFRDWASERTNYPRDVAEMALAHAIGDKVEAAYRRGDLFTKRAAMMQEWATFVKTERAPAEIVPLRNVA
jgi:integrase